MLDASKMERWRHFCRAKGWMYPSPAERLVARLTGRPARPWIFWPSWFVGLGYGVAVFAFNCAFMYLWASARMSLAQVVLSSGIIALIFLVVTALVHANQKNKYGLTSWDDF